MNVEDFKQAVARHWRHHAPCEHLNWQVQDGEDGTQIEVAPVYQEVLGGKQDGENVWAGFRFDLSGFFAERGLMVENVLAASYCTKCSETPNIAIRGTYFAQAFALRLHLEPVPGSEQAEVIDTISGKVRAIEGES